MMATILLVASLMQSEVGGGCIYLFLLVHNLSGAIHLYIFFSSADLMRDKCWELISEALLICEMGNHTSGCDKLPKLDRFLIWL